MPSPESPAKRITARSTTSRLCFGSGMSVVVAMPNVNPPSEQTAGCQPPKSCRRRAVWLVPVSRLELMRTARSLDKNDSTAGRSRSEGARFDNSENLHLSNRENCRDHAKSCESKEIPASHLSREHFTALIRNQGAGLASSPRVAV